MIKTETAVSQLVSQRIRRKVPKNERGRAGRKKRGDNYK